MNSKLASTLIGLTALVGLIGVAPLVLAATSVDDTCQPKVDAFCFAPELVDRTDVIYDISMPKIAKPAWLQQQASDNVRTVGYVVAGKGKVTVDMAEFKQEVAAILNSPQGWSRLGVRFQEVSNGGQFTVWISEDKQVPSFAPGGCDAIVSCTVGDNVIINQTRWLNGSDAWNAAGGSLVDYRRMVLNHETGHWLGHGHQHCSEAGADAAVMQQQTIDMQGCQPNPWPLVEELYAPKLGIYS